VTYPPAAQSFGAGRPPLDSAASATLASVRARMGGQRPFPQPPAKALTPEERAEAVAAIGAGGGCGCCGGIHAAEEWGCPRLAWFRRDADGRLAEGVFFADGQWDARRVIFADPADEAPEGGGNG
jgi:hypothetical protein